MGLSTHISQFYYSLCRAYQEIFPVRKRCRRCGKFIGSSKELKHMCYSPLKLISGVRTLSGLIEHGEFTEWERDILKLFWTWPSGN